MWFQRTTFRACVRFAVLVTIDGVAELSVISMIRTEIGGNRAVAIGSPACSTVSRPIRQPRNHHVRLPVGRLRRR